MESLFDIFPARREWPAALDDVRKAPINAASIRLTSHSKTIEGLSAFKSIKALWCFNISESSLANICECESLEALYIEELKSANLHHLSRLKNLDILGIEGCPKVNSLDSVSKLNSLSGLAITNFKNVHSLQPLSNLTSLRALGVSGSTWSKMEVDSFRPISDLKNLELLHLTNIKAKDESLSPLGSLNALRQLDIANFYPMSEFAWLSQKLKSTQCTWFKPFVKFSHSCCAKCGGNTLVMLTGKRKPTLCSECNSNALNRHVDEWNALCKQAKA